MSSRAKKKCLKEIYTEKILSEVQKKKKCLKEIYTEKILSECI